ncbi:MAG: HlyD family efflux transporter periplasmic adaptor subunit [Clostridiales bacterium]|nr:HlyD family efflux transporter periplasmic adaptor subunit [Clostridiales bacterium]
MENSVRKREWVKTAAIIFLAVLLVLTFFSKTIMNASLPEVAAQQAASGAINARIRGSGTVEASEVYNVTIKQTRKVASVLVKTGQEINVGDTMFVLEAEDSDELKQAETDLETLQQNYDKSLIEAGNTAAQENYDVQKARDAYNEALAIYRQYSTMDASQLATQKAAADAKLKELQTAKTTIDNQLTKLKADEKYTAAQATITEQEATIKTLEAEKEKLLETLPASYKDCRNASQYQTLINDTLKDENYIRNLARYEKNFATFSSLCDNDYAIMKECYENIESMRRRIEGGTVKTPVDEGGKPIYALTTDETAEIYKEAFKALAPFYYGYPKDPADGLLNWQDQLKIATVNDKIADANDAINNPTNGAKTIVGNYERSIDDLTKQSDSLDAQINDQQAAVDKLSSAASAAETVKSTKQALEDLIFKQNLGDSSSVDMEASKKAIERKQAEVDKLRENADELEVKSSVSGTIASINASAGKSIGGEEQPLATINVTDRGFTVKIDVTNDQAKKVKTGDTAELVNFWGGDAVATLDQITSSQTAGNRTLVFTLTGDIQAGQNVTLSIGQKSANYDALIPLSGLREDSNGKFVYVLESKSSPLGSRYIATRVTVQELARDDKSAAVSGISSGDFIITTSNKPVEAGKQVRLADNG